ncbi:Hypothetical protein, putative [Bodo saltans]|uniref:Complex 1 LYR protein domain-containing protein n=1 Tax=Bodo saltans TaxID=75058 RepID=A0A0S4J267_BODSA|nr:Hypothetical protein, putative [Bodo saltans]|eukprot:CUG05867.1 Hypothetical protein, putative [Bodo saltans]
MVLRCTLPLFRGNRTWFNAAGPNFLRANRRRAVLERRRLLDSRLNVPPVEPTAEMARSLYRRMIKEARKTLVCTDQEYFRLKVREEFEVTARQTSSRVRGIMYEKGQWMVQNRLGGIV